MGYFLFGSGLGLVLNHLLGAKTEGEQPKVGLNVKIHKHENQCLHIHHWMYLIPVILLILAVIKWSGGQITPPIAIFLGLLAGLIIYDFRYDDWHQIKVACQPPAFSPTKI